jgi:type IV secretory pathway VirB2 component (pilin)
VTDPVDRPFFSRPKVRLRLAQIIVSVGIVLAIIGVLMARYGWLFAGIIVIGIGAALGPARIGRGRSPRR